MSGGESRLACPALETFASDIGQPRQNGQFIPMIAVPARARWNDGTTIETTIRIR